MLPTPESVLLAHLHHGAWHVLVQWQGLTTDDATWELLTTSKTSTRTFIELFEETGRDVMTDIPYVQRKTGHAGVGPELHPV